MCVRECARESRNGEELTLAKIHLLFPERRQGEKKKRSKKKKKCYAITIAREEKLVFSDVRTTILKLSCKKE